jgi:hypothetical protein
VKLRQDKIECVLIRNVLPVKCSTLVAPIAENSSTLQCRTSQTRAAGVFASRGAHLVRADMTYAVLAGVKLEGATLEYYEHAKKKVSGLSLHVTIS